MSDLDDDRTSEQILAYAKGQAARIPPTIATPWGVPNVNRSGKFNSECQPFGRESL